MANVLHRKKSVGAVEVLPSAPDYVPTSLLHSGPDDDSPAQWPTGAKGAIAALTVAAVIATIGAAIAFGTGDDGSTERELRGQVESLTVDRDEAFAAVSDLDTEVAALRQDLIDAQTGNDDLDTDIAALETRMDALTDQLAASVVAADEADAALSEATVTADNLNAALMTERDRLAAAVTERDALAAAFPMRFTGSLADVDMVGKHSIQLTQVYCAGLASCGTAPSRTELTIRRTSEGFLRLDWPGYVDVGLSQASGALHAVSESNTALPTCDGSPRTANVTMTMFSGRYEIAASGARTVAGVTAVLTLEAPAVGSCPASLALYSAELTPKA